MFDRRIMCVMMCNHKFSKNAIFSPVTGPSCTSTMGFLSWHTYIRAMGSLMHTIIMHTTPRNPILPPTLIQIALKKN